MTENKIKTTSPPQKKKVKKREAKKEIEWPVHQVPADQSTPPLLFYWPFSIVSTKESSIVASVTFNYGLQRTLTTELLNSSTWERVEEIIYISLGFRLPTLELEGNILSQIDDIQTSPELQFVRQLETGLKGKILSF